MVNKFRLVLEGVPYEIERRGEIILVNGQEFPWSAKGGDAFTVGGTTHTVQLRGSSAIVDGIAYAIEAQGLEEPKAGKTRRSATADADALGVIAAVMPGLVIKVNKKEGDRVEAGEVVIVLEAMKMQNELQAKQSGVVKKINVKEGESVEMRQVLAVIE